MSNTITVSQTLIKAGTHQSGHRVAEKGVSRVRGGLRKPGVNKAGESEGCKGSAQVRIRIRTRARNRVEVGVKGLGLGLGE